MSLSALKPIGIIHTPFREVEGTPIQPVFAEDAAGTVTVFPEFAEGLKDLAGFERVWLIFEFDRGAKMRLSVVPFRDTQEHGVFATRSPCRPNPIGLSCVRLIGIEGTTLTVAGVDMLDGTPLLDVKPYVPAFDAFLESRAGWFDAQRTQRTRADSRFAD